MDDELRRSLEEEARMEDRPAAQLAARAIKAMVEARAAKREAIDAALNDANKGALISQDAMIQWMDSWGSDDKLPVPEPNIDSGKT